MQCIQLSLTLGTKEGEWWHLYRVQMGSLKGPPGCACPVRASPGGAWLGAVLAGLCAQAWKPSSQYAGEKRGVAGLLLGRLDLETPNLLRSGAPRGPGEKAGAPEGGTVWKGEAGSQLSVT